MPQIVFWHHCYLALRSRSKVGVKIKGQGQGQMSRSTFRRAAVDIRGSTLPSAAKGNRYRGHYQSSCVRLSVCDQWAYAGNCADTVDQLLITSGFQDLRFHGNASVDLV